MKRFRIFSLAIFVLVFFANTTTAYGQNRGATVTIRLRDTDGTPVAGERVRLLRPPENEPIPPDCTTDVNGECSWFVGRGLYALEFEELALDQLVALAVAEGGLTGPGITVGNEDITYGFVITNGNKVYNDLAPDSPVPEPFIPALEDVIHHEVDAHEHDEENILPQPETTPFPELTPVVPSPPNQSTPTSVSVTLITSGNSPGGLSTPEPGGWWPRVRFFLILGGGLVLGGAAFTWQQRRRKGEEAAKAKVLARLHAVIEAEPVGSGMNKE